MLKLYNELIKTYYIKEIIFKNLNIFCYNDFIKSNYFFYLKNKFILNEINFCYIEFIPINGGLDSKDLNNYYFNFYCIWLQKYFFNYEILENNINKKVLIIKNNFSFFLFKNESGIHRFIRKNPLINSNKIQTSFLTINIIPKINNYINILEKDLEIEFFKSKGPGGQHVNNTNSAVRITHKISGITINYQSERSQLKNKNNALQILEYKLLIKKNIEMKKFILNIKNRKYIKTYNFIKNEIFDHIKNKKYMLNYYFNYFINFLNL